jgi:hypothetical protein
VSRALRASCAILAAFAIEASAADAQSPSSRDSAVLAKYQHRDPCPATVPAVWLKPDSLLQKSKHCSLVAATARSMTSSSDPRFRNGVARAVCVFVHEWSFKILPAGSPDDRYWTIEFVDSTGNSMGARIDRDTGAIVLQDFGNEFNSPPSIVCASGRR